MIKNGLDISLKNLKEYENFEWGIKFKMFELFKVLSTNSHQAHTNTSMEELARMFKNMLKDTPSVCKMFLQACLTCKNFLHCGTEGVGNKYLKKCGGTKCYMSGAVNHLQGAPDQVRGSLLALDFLQ